VTPPTSQPLEGGDDWSHNPAGDFASGSSLRPALQEAKGETTGSGVQIAPPEAAGRTLPIHPIILRDVPPRPDSPPTQAQLNGLHRTLTERDLVILQCLYDYRYLDTLQVKGLFFPSLRSCQMRLQSLDDLGVIHRWKVIETPGVRRRHSLLLISSLGARVLADRHKDQLRTYLERARNARDHCWHALHDLEANQFFVSLAIDSCRRADEGLLVWQGEDQARIDYRQRAREYRWPAPAPDAGGAYLAAAGQIQFDLEWDRATESVARLRQKIASHVGFWTHFRNPEAHHVLVVLPTDERESRVQRAIWLERPHYQSQDCCTFWTTSVHRLRRWGAADAIWLAVNLKADKPLRADETTLRLRTPLNRFRAIGRSPGTIEDCIGKPHWWERRPGGGEAA
jgi:Replication-relaxation